MQIDPDSPEGAAWIAANVPECFRATFGRINHKPTHITCERCDESFLRADIDHTRNDWLCFPCSAANPPDGPYLNPHREWGTWG